MLNWMAAVKALMLLLSASAVLVPVVHGLAVYGWNIRAMVIPTYSPPKIDFRIEPSGLRFDKGQLYSEFKLTNLGEVKVVFEGLNVEVYGPDGKALAPASLDKAVVSLPGSIQTLTLKIEVNEAALSRIASYFMGGRDRVNIEVKGEAILRVFGSRVTTPISSSFELSLTDILNNKSGDGTLVFVKVLTMNYRFNLLGVASSFLLFYTALSNDPWWTVYGGIGGERTFSAEVSPFNISVEVLGKPVIVPMLFYLTMAARLSILLAAATTLLGSLLVNKLWSKPLISLRGLILPVLFLAGLFILLNLARLYANVSLPLIGRSTIEYTINYGGLKIDTETAVEAALTQMYWIALTAGALSALAKALHGRIAGDHP